MKPMSLSARAFLARASAFARTSAARRTAWCLLGLVLVVAVTGFLIAPPLVKQKLETELSSQLHRKTSIEQVRINPFALSITLQGLSVKQSGNDGEALQISEVYASVSTATLFRWAPVLNRIRLTAPHLSLVRNADKTYNYQDLIDELLAKPAAPTPAFSLNNIEIIDGAIDFDDQPEKQKHLISELNVGIPFLSSLPYAADIKVQPVLAMKVDGAQFAVTGDTTPFEDTRQTTLNLNIDALQLPRFLDYSPVPLKLKLASAQLDTRLKLAFALRDNKPGALTITGDARLSKLDMRDAAGTPVLSLPLLAVELESVDLLGYNAKVRSLRLDGLDAHLTRAKNGALNLMSPLPAPGKAAKGKTEAVATANRPLKFQIAELQLTNGTLHLEDDVPANPFRTTLSGVALSLRGLGNEADAKATGNLAFKSEMMDGFAWNGGMQLTPMRADGKLELSGLSLAALRPYYDKLADIKIAQGTLDLSGAFAAAFADGKLAARFSDAAAAVKSLQLATADGKLALARVALFAVKGLSADFDSRVASIGEISGQDAVASVTRDAAGRFNWSQVIKPRPSSAISGSEFSASAPWKINVKRIALERLTVEYQDNAQKTPIKSRVSQLAITADDLSNAQGAKGRVDIRALVNNAGRFTLAGVAGVNPVSFDLRVDATAVDLLPLQRLVEDKLNITITSGALFAKGALTLADAPGAPFKAAYKGNAKVTGFASIDKLTLEDLLKWKSLSLAGIDAASSPLKATVNEIALEDFYSRLIVNPDGTLNVQHIVKKPGDAETTGTSPPVEDPTVASSAQAAAPLPVPVSAATQTPALAIGKITLARGGVNFTDHFIKPNYSADLSEIAGSVGKMTQDTAGDVELHGFVQKTAPLAITGSVNPLAKDLFLDIKADAKNIELPPLTAYSIRYAGYSIDKGKLSMDVKYHLENRKLLAENHVNLDQLTFGEKVDSPTATKLPVLLAVSLLKDRNGVIDINLPISGSLDDPQFSMGGIIVKVIVNLFVKAVTSPFALIGSMFGGGEELAYVEFTPGRAAITPDSEKKLVSIAKALAERPALKMEIAGRVDAESDRAALRQVQLERKIKAQKLKTLLKSGEATPSLDEIRIEPGEYEKFLTAAYKDEKFAKPRNVIGLAKSLPPAEIEKLMLANAAASDENLRELGTQRAQAVEDWLVHSGNIPVERMFLLAPKLSAEGIKDKGRASRADFALR